MDEDKRPAEDGVEENSLYTRVVKDFSTSVVLRDWRET